MGHKGPVLRPRYIGTERAGTQLILYNLSATFVEFIEMRCGQQDVFVGLTYLLIYFLTYLLTYLLTYFLTYSLTYSLIYLLIYFLTYLLTHLLTFLLSYLLTYLLTPWSRVFLQKLTGSPLVKKFPTFYGTRRFITAFTSARHLSLT